MCSAGTFLDGLMSSIIHMAGSYYVEVSSLCLIILSCCGTIWFLWVIGRLAASIPVDGKSIFDEIVAIICAESFLAQPAWLWDFFQAVYTSATWAAGKAILTGGGESPTTIGALSCYALNGLQAPLLDPVMALSLEISPINLSVTAWVILLAIAIFILFLKMLRHIAEPMAGIATVFILSPFLVLFSAVPLLRSTVLNALKRFVSELLSLIIVTSIVGIITTMAVKAYDYAAVVNGTITSDRYYLGSPSYFMTLAITVFFIFTMDKMILTTASIMDAISGGRFELGMHLPSLGKK